MKGGFMRVQHRFQYDTRLIQSRHRDFKRYTNFHQLAYFFVHMMISNAYDRIHGHIFQTLLLCFFGAHEFNERVNASLVAVVHAINFIHHNGNALWFALKHGQHAVLAHVVFRYQINNGFIAYITCVIFHHIIIKRFEQLHNKFGFSHAGVTINIYSSTNS